MNKVKSCIRNILPRTLIEYIDYLKLKEQWTYSKDGLYTIHNSSFIFNNNFSKAYIEGKKTGSWGNEDIEWRAHVVLYFAKLVSVLEGDYVECGVNLGGLSRAVIEYLDFGKLNRKFYLLDTFDGFDKTMLNSAENEKYKDVNWYNDTYSRVVDTFKQYKNVEIIRGSVPNTLSQVNSDKIAYLSIDMNHVFAEREALNFFWNKLVSGGVIILDDYAYAGFEPQYESHTKWAKEMNIEILTLPTGQGVIIKNQ